MANKEHLEILQQGVEVWNKWREENPEIVPDLSGADLSDLELSLANLSHCNLSEIELKGSILNETNLSNSDLSRSRFIGVILWGVNLSYSAINYTKLTNTILFKNYFQQTDFTKVVINKTIFVQTNLSTAIGLDRISYIDYGSIDTVTLHLSQGKIPEIFLEACGITDELLQALPQLLGIQPEVQHIEVPMQANEPTLEQEEIDDQFELLKTYRSHLKELLKSRAIFGIGRTDPHITLGIRDIRRKIAERKAYLRAHGVEVKDFYDDVER